MAYGDFLQPTIYPDLAPADRMPAARISCRDFSDVAPLIATMQRPGDFLPKLQPRLK